MITASGTTAALACSCEPAPVCANLGSAPRGPGAARLRAKERSAIEPRERSSCLNSVVRVRIRLAYCSTGERRRLALASHPTKSPDRKAVRLTATTVRDETPVASLARPGVGRRAVAGVWRSLTRKYSHV